MALISARVSFFRQKKNDSEVTLPLSRFLGFEATIATK